MIKRAVVCCLMFFAVTVWGAWPTYHGDAGLRGFADAELGDALNLVWRYNAGGEVFTTPVSDGEQIYLSAKKGRVIALDLQGSIVWEKAFTRTNDAGQDMPLRFEASLACLDGLVFAGSTKGTLFALDAKDGSTKWKYETGGIIVGSPNFVKPGRVLLMDQSEGLLHGVDVQTGKPVWKSEAAERCDGAPGVGREHIAYGSCLAALHVYGLDGKHQRDIEVGGDGQIAGGVAIEDSIAYAGLRDGALIAVNLADGEVLWVSEESQDQTFSTPAVTDQLVVYSSDDGFVYAVNKKDGELVWTYDTGGIPYSPVVAQHRVVVSADGVLYVLKLDDGTEVWTKEVSDEISSPAIIHGMIVVGADDGTVSAYGDKK